MSPVQPGSAALVGLVAVWNILQNRVLPRWTYTALNAIGTVGFLALVRRMGVADRELGIDPARLRCGVAVGAAAGSIGVAATLVAAKAKPAWFGDVRVATTNPVYETMVRIPAGTALFEEAVFRGALKAVVGANASNVMFGLWHVLPTVETARQNEIPVVPAVIAGVAATTVAGQGLGWLREVSGSLAAPVVAHAAVNIAGYVAARRSLSHAQIG